MLSTAGIDDDDDDPPPATPPPSAENDADAELTPRDDEDVAPPDPVPFAPPDVPPPALCCGGAAPPIGVVFRLRWRLIALLPFLPAAVPFWPEGGAILYIRPTTTRWLLFPMTVLERRVTSQMSRIRAAGSGRCVLCRC